MAPHSLSSYIIDFVTLAKGSAVINIGLQIFNYIFNFLLIVCPFLADEKHKGKIWYTTLKRVIGIYPLLAKMTLFLSGSLLYLEFYSNLPALLLSSAINLFNIIVLGNYHLKKEENYKSSQRGAIILQLGLIGQILINTTLVQVGNSNIYIASAAFFGLLYLIWQLVVGYQFYVHSTSRKIHLFFSTMMIASSLNYTLLIFPVKSIDTFNFIDFIILFVTVCVFLRVYEEKRRFWFENPEILIKNQPWKLKQN